MSGWHLRLRAELSERVDARPIRLADFQRLNTAEINQLTLNVAGIPMVLGDLFLVSNRGGDPDRLVLEGDLSCFDGLASDHHRGEFRLLGSAGDHFASGMQGGVAIVEGDVGAKTGAPIGARRSGMRGGRVVICGSAGDYMGHRMRRGEILVEGDCGDFTASHQVAGTIVVAGKLGSHPAYGMRRGTLISQHVPPLPPDRFSPPTFVRSVFPTLLRRSLSLHGRITQATTELAGQLPADAFISVRGDTAVSGCGEILTPPHRSRS